MTQPRKKNTKKNATNANNEDQIKSLREEFVQENQTMVGHPMDNDTGDQLIDDATMINDKNNPHEDASDTPNLVFHQNDIQKDITPPAFENQKADVLDSKQIGPSASNFENDLKQLRSLDSDLTVLNEEVVELPAYLFGEDDDSLQSPIAPISSSVDQAVKIKTPNEINRAEQELKQTGSETMDPDPSNENFIQEISDSLENDQYLLSKNENINNPVEELEASAEKETSDYVTEIENEIQNAEHAVNPFVVDTTSDKDADFMSKLQELFPETYQVAGSTKPLLDYDEPLDNENSLSRESWQDVIHATEELISSNFPPSNLLDQNQKYDYDIPHLENELESQYPTVNSNVVFEDSGNSQLSYVDSYDDITDGKSNYGSGEFDENGESVDVLRRSFIEEFEQTPWIPDEEPAKDEGWIKNKYNAIKNWIKSLNTAEKILLVMSTVISLAVIIAIGLVIINWQSSNVAESAPPEIIDSAGTDLVYPTGLQLPGGWFFFLQQGIVENNKWDPQTAEWLPTSTIRRVVAIPWSRQAEAVVQTLKTGDEIRLFMNNNDILNYYVESITQIDRENVEILTDTDPSLAVILFKSDNSDRWVVVAKP